MAERSQRETIATGTSPTKNHLTRTTEGRPHSGMRRVGGAWEAEREREKRNIFLERVLFRANFFPAVSFDFDRSRSRRFSVPPMENAFPLTQIREGAEEQNDAGKMGKRYTHPLMERPTDNYYHRKIHGLYNGREIFES